MAELRRPSEGYEPRGGLSPADLDLLRDRRLLVLTHGYNHFVKGQVDVLADYVESVHVLVRYNRLADLAANLPIDYPKPFTSDAKMLTDDKPENVTVLGTPLLYVPIDAHRRVLGDQHARKAKSVLADLDVSFDLIHSHLTWTAGYVGSVLQRELDTPHVLTVHENRDLLRSEIERDRGKLSEAWSAPDSVIRVNRADQSILQQFNDDVRYVPNGFAPETFEAIPREDAKAALDVPLDRPLLFGLGHLKERKGFQHLVEVLPTVVDRVGEVTCAIGGHGEMRPKLERRIQELGLEDRCELLGYVPRERLKYWMSGCDALVLPSYSESFGLVQLEAMACGAPVVSTRNGGSEEVIVSEEHGLLVDHPEAHDQLADAIVEAIDREWDREAIRRYASGFTWENVCTDIATIYVEHLRERA